MSLGLYLVGFAFIIAGVAWVLSAAGVTTLHIAMVSLILIGLAIVTGVVNTRPKDPPNRPTR